MAYHYAFFTPTGFFFQMVSTLAQVTQKAGLSRVNLQDFSRLQFSGEYSKAQKHWPGHLCQANWCYGFEFTLYAEWPWMGIQDGPECPVCFFSFWSLILSFFYFNFHFSHVCIIISFKKSMD